MTRLSSLCAALLLSATAFSQSNDDTLAFEIADVHPSVLTGTNQFRKGPTLNGGRYEVKTATMLDLVTIAYGYNADKVLEGPSWLELNRYDVIAKAPADAKTADKLKPALQKLLADRFQLVVKEESKPMPARALVPGKKLLIKEAAGQEEPGCKPVSDGAPNPNGGMLMMMDQSGKAQRFVLGPGGTVTYQCRNVTMDSFAANLQGMIGSGLGSNPILNQTAMEGHWNFDLTYSVGMVRMGDGEQRVSMADAIDKQLGLKLEVQQLPTPVIRVLSVNEKPTPNPPGLAERLKIPPPPTEFEVAAIKPFEPGSGPMMFMTRVQPGGRVEIQGQTLRSLVLNAWDLRPEMLINAPSWMDSDRYDILAKVASEDNVDFDMIWPLVQKLIKDRFKLEAHTEERPITAYNLVAVKPKMKKADPNSRSHIQNGPPQDGKDPRPANSQRTRYIAFTNISMPYFASQLHLLAGGYLQSPVLDKTGLEGGWDFILNFSPNGMVAGGRARPRGGDGAAAEAEDPGDAISLFEAIDKQLGLKLESEKRQATVLVIDKIERKPIDN